MLYDIYRITFWNGSRQKFINFNSCILWCVSHPHNIYLQWLIESIPEDVVDNYFLHEIEGHFIAEAQYGDTVLSLTKELKIKNTFAHTIKIKGNHKVCATAKTIWKAY